MPDTFHELLGDVERLGAALADEAADIAAGWDGWIERAAFAPSAANFAAYLALRRRDLRPLQRRLMAAGLSSLGRSEARVEETLAAVLAALCALAGDGAAPPPSPRFFAGEARLEAAAAELLGPGDGRRPARILVTLPSEAASDPSFAMRLAELGVEAVRINCAHDDADAWARMVEAVGVTGERAGRRMRVFMDLGGPKIRTGAIRAAKGGKRVRVGDRFAIVAPGRLGDPVPELRAVECTLTEPLAAARPGERVFLDDGKLSTEIVSVADWGVVVEARGAPDDGEGYKLKPEKGVNFPETDFAVDALTDKDVEDLSFVAHRADAVEFSFVQRPEDIVHLQDALARERPGDWRSLGLVLKIETVRAVRNLPDMLVRAAGRQPTGLMIARGDLAVEIGFARLAEMQEELLWLGEACQIPVIWATQVLESYVKTGAPSRGEMTDAAMGARAECVMLNKGPHLFEALADLDRLLVRMGGHMQKKTPRLRRLTSW